MVTSGGPVRILIPERDDAVPSDRATAPLREHFDRYFHPESESGWTDEVVAQERKQRAGELAEAVRLACQGRTL
jgi:hypothetical protein